MVRLVTLRLCYRKVCTKMISLDYANHIKTFDYRSGRNPVEQEALTAVIEGRPLTPVFEAHGLNLEERKALLEAKLWSPHEGEQCSLFLLAVVCGHVDLTRTLLEENLVDPDQKGTVLVGIYKDHDVKLGGFAYEVGEEVTPLWCAAAWCKLEVMKVLVNHGASVCCSSKGGSLPLFMACQYYDRTRKHNFALGRPDAPVQLELVKYLVENLGADVNTVARFGNTPLTGAAVTGYKDPSLVTYLLKKGANPNAQNLYGSTALHLAAERGCLETVKELINHGAQQLFDSEGLTPLHRACCGCHDDVVDYLISLPDCSREQKVDALELLGASHATFTDVENIEYPSEGASEEEEGDKASIQQGYQLMVKAMNERFSSAPNILKSSMNSSVTIYNNRSECPTMEELEAISTDNEAVCMEGFIIRERILGALSSAEILEPLVTKAVLLAHEGNLEKAVHFYTHALSFKIVSSLESKDILRRVLYLLARMVEENVSFTLASLEPIFEYIIARLKHIIQKKEQIVCDPNLSQFQVQEFAWAFDFDLLYAFYFICILNSVINTGEEANRKCQMVKELIELNVRNSVGAELVHLAVWDSIIPVHNKVVIGEVFKVPNKRILELLVQCGADLNAQDNLGNSPLHLLAAVDPKLAVVPEQFKQNGGKVFVDWFKQNGANFDLHNAAGHRPVDVATSEITKGFLQVL